MIKMIKNEKIKKIVRAGLGCALITVCAYISVPTPVPFTLQTLGIFTVCLMFDFTTSLLSVTSYVVLGALGLPVFSGFRGGLGVTGGYIIGFMLVPVILKFCKKNYLGMFVSLVAVYAVGTVWYSVVTDTGILPALMTCVLPFVIPDVIKIYISKKLSERMRKL